MEQIVEEPVDTGTPLVLEHDEGRTLDTPAPAASDGQSELEQHRQAKAKSREVPAPVAAEPAAELDGDAPATPEKEKKAADRWQDPDTGDTYDMRHKVSRRIKTLLGDRGTLRGEVEQLRRENKDLTERLMAQGMPRAEAKAEATAIQAAAAEPDPNDVTKYPEGQFDRAYMRDIARFEAKREFETGLQTANQHAVERQREQAFEQTVTKWNESLPEARQKYADFDAVLEKFPRTPVNAPIADVLMSSPVGNDILHLIGTNEGAWHAYYQQAQTEQQRYRVLYHIEAQLMGRARAAQAKAKTATTAAPSPITPVASGAPTQQVTDWSRSDDPDQLARWRAQRKRTR